MAKAYSFLRLVPKPTRDVSAGFVPARRTQACPLARCQSGCPTPARSRTAATVALPLAKRSISPWLVAVAVVIPTFMEVLDTTIANVALRYIAGGLSAPSSD